MSAYIVGKRAGLGAAAGSISIFLPSEYANVYIYIYIIILMQKMIIQCMAGLAVAAGPTWRVC